MFCPNCGNTNSTEQKFCRSCGLSLQKIVQSLGEQLPTKATLSVQQRKEKFEKLGMAALTVFGGGLLIPILYSIFYKVMWTQGRITSGLGMLALLLVLISGVVSVILFAKANEVKEISANRNPAEPVELSATENTGQLPNDTVPPQPAFSVAERTTELLLAEKNAHDKERSA